LEKYNKGLIISKLMEEKKESKHSYFDPSFSTEHKNCEELME